MTNDINNTNDTNYTSNTDNNANNANNTSNANSNTQSYLDEATAKEQGYYFGDAATSTQKPHSPPPPPQPHLAHTYAPLNTPPYSKHTQNPSIPAAPTAVTSLRHFFQTRLNFKNQGAKIISFALLMIMCLTTLISLATPLLRTTFGTITPFNLLFAQGSLNQFTTAREMLFLDAGLPYLNLTYWVSFAFYAALSVTLLIVIAAGIFVFINKKHDKTSAFCDIAMPLLTILLFFAMLFNLNFANIYTVAAPYRTITVGGIGAFIISLILLIAKYFVNFCFKTPTNDEFVSSKLSVATSFILLVLVISTLFAPLYILDPFYRISGLGILRGDVDRLSFLPTVGTFRTFIVLFLIIYFISFCINLFLYIASKRVFVQYNKFNTMIGIISLAIYALIGLNYIVLLVDTRYFVGEWVFFYSWNTFSYIPLALFGMYILGLLAVKLTQNRQNIEYKVYAKAGARRGGTGGTNEGGQIQKTNPEDLEITGYDPIPAFSEIDGLVDKFDEQYQKNLQFKFEGVTLPLLVDHIIDYAKNSEQNLSYGKREIKTFIAGLGASKLSILQGMSGTGKTSLPKIFMEAIGGYCEMIAVESSWRDKNELLGYYNEFNKKFTPKAFTQSLYKASLNIDTPVFIVLDEMNLSRIEYYFSDFLSLMEAREEDRSIKLFDVQLYPETDDRTEYLSLNGGHTLKIPKNIWFVGTANRDESTFEISDKVYDRAQTMNFDKRAPKVIKNNAIDNPIKFVTMTQLGTLFDECKALEFDAEGNALIKKVESILWSYRISFGNRILRQIEEFVKVYLAASGAKNSNERDEYIHEALDCIILSKIVRKLEFKQINDIDELIEDFKPLKLPLCSAFLIGLQN